MRYLTDISPVKKLISLYISHRYEVGTSDWAPASTKRHTVAFLDADSQSITLAPRTEDFDAVLQECIITCVVNRRKNLCIVGKQTDTVGR